MQIEILYVILAVFAWFIYRYYRLYHSQDRLLYVPILPDHAGRELKYNAEGLQSPEDCSMHYKDVWIKTEDGLKLHGWFISQTEQNHCATVVIFHGNAGNIGHRMEDLHFWYYRCKSNILIFDYRGYGNSQGTPSEDGLRLDADAVTNYVFTQLDINKDKVFLFGRSLGAAAATYTAWTFEKPLRQLYCALILENAFCSVPDVADTLLPGFAGVPMFLNKNFWPVYSWMPDIHIPILFIVGKKDTLVHPRNTEELRGLANKSPTVEVMEIENAGHNNVREYASEEYFNKMVKFMAEQIQFRRELKEATKKK